VLALCLAGLEAEAAIAERAAAARATAEHDEAAGVAAGLLQRARATVTADGIAPTRMGQGMLLTAEAHHSRLTGRGDPDRWAEAATAWEDLSCPWPAAYAHWRQAEALLAAGVPRDQAAPPLRRAWTTASALKAQLLLAEVESLGRRARIELAPAPSPADGTEREDTPDTGLRRLGLTPRETEVLGLVAEGRTNRQIAEALFISDRTASVHVSNILTKLGVANRAEAAVAAHRLGLTPSGDSAT
jgi:DNA-binding CsgD family transcriptional regulator